MATYVLVGASEFNDAAFLQARHECDRDFVIAVDGGFASLASVGFKPALVIGDFDSLGYVPKDVRVERFSPEKDASDMELALRYARSRRADRVIVYGALGWRLDHTLANLQLFAAAAEDGLDVEIVGERERIVFLVGPGELNIERPDEGTVSVFSLTDESCGVVEEGLRYGLDGVTLTNRTSWGLSNELAGAPARIALDSGTLAVFLPL